jgi:hypothetical protein
MTNLLHSPGGGKPLVTAVRAALVRAGAGLQQLDVPPAGAGEAVNYLRRIPARLEIPTGHVLVHNHVRPTQWLGGRGFRAWLQRPSVALECCACGWAPWLSVHYRMLRPGAPAQTEVSAVNAAEGPG